MLSVAGMLGIERLLKSSPRLQGAHSFVERQAEPQRKEYGDVKWWWSQGAQTTR